MIRWASKNRRLLVKLAVGVAAVSLAVEAHAVWGAGALLAAVITGVCVYETGAHASEQSALRAVCRHAALSCRLAAARMSLWVFQRLNERRTRGLSPDAFGGR
jgi:hypothetical protein